jgi:hypothetical protein
MALSYGLLDAKSVFILYGIKVYRLMVFWIILYAMDKVYQTKYVEDVYVAHAKAPSIIFMPMYMVAVESFFFLLMFCVLLTLEKHFRNRGNTYVVDDTLLAQVMVDYVLTTLSILPSCVAVAVVVTTTPALRFGHDGLRGIRASTTIMLLTITVLLAVPMFLAY